MSHPDEQVAECLNPAHIVNCNGDSPECQDTGNDLAASDCNANTDAANPPKSTPPNTRDTDIDEILQHYKEYVTGVYQGIADYDEATAKAAITKKLTELLLAELQEVKNRSESHLNSDGRTMRRAYLEERIAVLTKGETADDDSK